MTMHGQAMKQFSSPGAQQCSCLGGCGVVVESGARSGFIPGDQDKEPHSAEGTLHFCPLLLLDAVTSFTSPHMDTNRPSFTPKFQGIGGRSPAALEPCSRLPTSFRQAWGSTPITAPLLSARARHLRRDPPKHRPCSASTFRPGRHEFQVRRTGYDIWSNQVFAQRPASYRRPRHFTSCNPGFSVLSPWLKLPHLTSLPSYSTSCIVLLNPPLPHHRLPPPQ